MEAYDLFKLIEENSIEPRDIVQDINNLIIELEDYPTQYINKLKTLVEEYAEAKGICPFCCEDMSLNFYFEARGEYQGSCSFELMSEYKCKNNACKPFY